MILSMSWSVGRRNTNDGDVEVEVEMRVRVLSKISGDFVMFGRAKYRNKNYDSITLVISNEMESKEQVQVLKREYLSVLVDQRQ